MKKCLVGSKMWLKVFLEAVISIGIFRNHLYRQFREFSVSRIAFLRQIQAYTQYGTNNLPSPVHRCVLKSKKRHPAEVLPLSKPV